MTPAAVGNRQSTLPSQLYFSMGSRCEMRRAGKGVGSSLGFSCSSEGGGAGCPCFAAASLFIAQSAESKNLCSCAFIEWCQQRMRTASTRLPLA